MPIIRGNARSHPPVVRTVIQPVNAESLADPAKRFHGVDCRALLDTGADGTSVTRALAEAAMLSSQGKTQATGLSGSGWHRSWTAFVGVYATDEIGPLPLVFPEPVLAIEVSPYPAFDMIIGRDLLMLGTFTLKTSGDFEWVLPLNF
jgi:Aspartyl protease